jgi:hypothetical protein
MKHEADKLTGNALAWAVCLAMGYAPVMSGNDVCYRNDEGSFVVADFTSEAQVGTLMSEYWVGVERPSKGQKVPLWRAIADTEQSLLSPFNKMNSVVSSNAETIGAAVCRAIVKAKLGTSVELPF